MFGLAMDWYRIPVRALSAPCLDIIKKILIAIVVIAALLGARALAADLVSTAPPAVPYSNWSGPYLGIGVGARFNAIDANVTSATVGTPPTAIPLPPVSQGTTNALAFWQQNQGAMQYLDHIAGRAGMYGGWNFQVASAYVVGVEGDFAFANEAAVFHGSPYPANLLFGSPSFSLGASPNDEFKVRTTWDGSARLRAGWLANPSMLLYLTGGVAWAHLHVTSTCTTVPTPNVSNCAHGNYFSGTLGPEIISHSATKLGWTAGIGVDTWLWSNWLLRAQYRYSDFGYLSFGDGSAFNFTDTRTCNGCPSAASSPLTVSYQLRLMQHIFELGLAYKF
jgi:outer membrane immunogenic protein